MFCKSVKYGLSKKDDRCRGLETEVLRRVLEPKVEKGAERWKIGNFILLSKATQSIMLIKSKKRRWLGMHELYTWER